MNYTNVSVKPPSLPQSIWDKIQAEKQKSDVSIRTHFIIPFRLNVAAKKHGSKWDGERNYCLPADAYKFEKIYVDGFTVKDKATSKHLTWCEIKNQYYRFQFELIDEEQAV